MRCKHVVVGLALTFATMTGCKQQCFLPECDYNHYHELVPPSLECDAHVPINPAAMNVAKPPTVDDPERTPRYLTLAEAIAIAAEQGTVGQQNVFLSPGFASDNPLDLAGRTIIGGDSIRAFALDPAIAAADIEASLSKFDVQWNTSINWTTTDQPQQGINTFNNGQAATVSTSLLKPLPTGGVAGITFSTNYADLTNPPRGFPLQNPAYTPKLQFQFEQPLLLGYGVEINQLRATHPGSVLTPFPTGGRVEGILITRLRFDQARAEFEKTLDFMLVNVEVAYWNLYGSYWTLYAREQALRQAYEAWRINKARFDAGKVNIMDLSQTRQQFELFRFQRMLALGTLLESERQLRALLNLDAEDGTRLIPIDAPTLTPYKPDWATAVNEALTLRPDLVLARQDLKFRQLDLINVKNLLLPDLRFTSTYALNGLGNRLDGAGETTNAFRSLASDRFADWSIGLRLTVPLGYRDVHSQLRVARLNLGRSYIVLQDQEKRAIRTLRQQYSHLVEYHHEIEIQRSQRLAAATQLDGRFKEFLVGKGTLDILLESQRVWSQALSDEFTAVVQYNNALAGFEFAKGTILQHDSVVISEGALPQCAQVRAVAHEQERKKAIILRERQNPVLTPPCDYEKGCLGLPEIPANAAPALPAVLEGRQPVPEITDPWVGPKAAPALNAATPSKASTGLPSISSDSAMKSRPEVPQMLPVPIPGRDKTSGSLPPTLSTGDNIPKLP